MSLKIISRSLFAVALAAGVASAQLLNTKSMDVIRVEKIGISAGKIDSLSQLLAMQQAPGQKLNEEMMSRVRYAVIDNLVGQELLKLECKKQGIKVSASKVDSVSKLFKAQVGGEENFQKELKKSHTTLEQFKSRIEDQLKTEILIEKKIPYPKDPTEEEMKAYWTLNKSKVPINDSISGIRIYIKTKGKSTQDISDTKDMLKGAAAQIRSQVRSKKIPFSYAVQLFAQQAMQISDDPDVKKTGGGMMTTLKGNGAAFEKAVSKLNVGDFSDVYNDREGISIFLLTGKNDGKFESYRSQIDAALRMQAEQERQMKLRGYLDELAKVYKVQYLDKKYTPSHAIGGK